MDDITTTRHTLDAQLQAQIGSDPLSALRSLHGIRTIVADREREAVRSSLENHTWAEIGQALGVSKQAAYQRFGKAWAAEVKAEMRTLRGDAYAQAALGRRVQRTVKS
jgi:hypothetical protein